MSSKSESKGSVAPAAAAAAVEADAGNVSDYAAKKVKQKLSMSQRCTNCCDSLKYTCKHKSRDGLHTLYLYVLSRVASSMSVCCCCGCLLLTPPPPPTTTITTT
jgi:hypothetical protein